MFEKKSNGILLFNKRNGKYEVLLVRKRFTYAFAELVNSKYSRANALEEIESKINQMTVEEVLDVQSKDFNKMWSRVWGSVKNLSEKEKKMYKVCLDKFHKNILKDGGVKLDNIIKKYKERVELKWEIPKGRADTSESDIVCAVREFKEETGISKEYYNIVSNQTRNKSYISGNIKYTFKYYIAVTNKKSFHYYDKHIDVAMASEIGKLKWMTIEQMRLLENCDDILKPIILPALRYVKKLIRNKNKHKGEFDDIIDCYIPKKVISSEVISDEITVSSSHQIDFDTFTFIDMKNFDCSIIF